MDTSMYVYVRLGGRYAQLVDVGTRSEPLREELHWIERLEDASMVLASHAERILDAWGIRATADVVPVDEERERVLGPIRVSPGVTVEERD